MTAAAKTPAQRGRANRNRGIQAERDLCKWLRANGFPHAERAVRTGFRSVDRTGPDPGDITGTPLILWSVKDCAVEQVTKWFEELDDMSDNAATYTLVRLIVHKRRGHADPGLWWCWMQAPCLVELATDNADTPLPPFFVPIRTELRYVAHLLRAAGYGSPLEVLT